MIAIGALIVVWLFLLLTIVAGALIYISATDDRCGCDPDCGDVRC